MCKLGHWQFIIKFSVVVQQYFVGSEHDALWSLNVMMYGAVLWVFICSVAESVFVNESAELKMSFVSHKHIVYFMLIYTSQEFMLKIYVVG